MTLRPLAVLFFLLISQAGLTAPSQGEVLTKGLNAPLQNKKIETVDEGFSIAEPGSEKKTAHPLSKKESIKMYTYHQAFSLSLGAALTSDSTNGQLAFHYLLPNESSWQFEVGAQIFQRGFGALSLSYRKTWNKYSLFRPYISPTIAIHSDGESAIAEFIEIDNFRIETYFGLEQLVLAPFSLRIESGLSLGKSNTALLIRLGLSWGWY